MLGIGLTGGDDVGHDSGDGEIQGRGNKLGETPGLEAELLRGSGGAWARRSVVPAAAQSPSVAERGGGGELGFVAALACMIGSRGAN